MAQTKKAAAEAAEQTVKQIAEAAEEKAAKKTSKKTAAKAEEKAAAKEPLDAVAPITELIAKAKKDGTIQASVLSAALEKLDISPEKIEQIYDTFDAMGIQIVSAELDIDVDDEMPPLDTVEEEELIDPVELAAEYNLDDP
ncbi:MAG: hypothetical protein IKC04_00510, partial [Oscillospiraceae bacterium]|nr:hypothetical protein [Oscillospiraceae bacterium]